MCIARVSETQKMAKKMSDATSTSGKPSDILFLFLWGISFFFLLCLCFLSHYECVFEDLNCQGLKIFALFLWSWTYFRLVAEFQQDSCHFITSFKFIKCLFIQYPGIRFKKKWWTCALCNRIIHAIYSVVLKSLRSGSVGHKKLSHGLNFQPQT